MDISAYLLQGFNILPKINVIINSVTIEAVIDTSTHRDNKTYGGFEPDQECVLAIQTSLLTNPKSLKGKEITINNEKWRILNIRYGASICHLTCVSTDKT